MLKILPLPLALFLAFAAFEQPGAAGSEAPPPPSAAALGADAVKTEFFSLRLPPGWLMPYPVKRNPDGVSAVFHSEKADVTVTVNVIEAPLSLKALTDSVLPGMKKSGLNPQKPVMENGLSKVVFKGRPRGAGFFGSNGKMCAAVIILSQAQDISAANEILGALKSPQKSLFPAKIAGPY